MNQQSGHLSDQQIRECADTVPGGSPEEVEAHLSQCESCLGRLLEWQRTQFRIGEADAMRPKPYADCPEENTLQEVAAEMASPETSARILQHASQCNRCGPLLKQYLEDFSDELSPKIEALIDQLPFSQPQWQRQKAHEIVRNLSAKPVPWWQGLTGLGSRRWLPATAGAMATLLVAIGITRGPAIWNWEQLWSAKGSISDAYAQKRTIPVRLTGVKAGPLDQGAQTMGSGDVEDLDWKLSRAQATLSGKLSSDDPRWRQIAGRILLLKHQPEEAKKKFQEAQSMGLNTFSLDIDLAMADFERERLRVEQESKKDSKKSPPKPDLRNTINELKRISTSTGPALTPEERKTALYNLALAYQADSDFDDAISTWEEYLKVDPEGAWADDARDHLEKDRKKQSAPHGSYLNPVEYNRHVGDPVLIRGAEEYLRIAFERDWMVHAIEDPASEAGKAVHDIAKNFIQQHSDPMLAEFLRSAETGRPPRVRALNAAFTPGRKLTEDVDCPGKNGDNDRLEAIRALSTAFADTKNDKQTEAIGCSRRAAELFHSSGNRAGELLAQYQKIYALQRKLSSPECLEQVERVWPTADATPYHWLRGQLALERAICATRELKNASAKQGLDDSRFQADKYDFPELNLHIIGAKAGLERLNHLYQQAWRTATEGLEQYWKEPSSPERYYQFYAVMRLIAADSGYLYASEAYLRRSIEIFETMVAPDDLGFTAILYTTLANLKWELGDNVGADAASRHARELLTAIQGGKPADSVYFEVPAIELADFELRRHQPERALSTLQQIGNEPQTHDSLVQLDFYRVRGEAKLQSGRFDDATADYQHGLDVAQKFFKDSSEEAMRLKWVLATNKLYAGFVQVLLVKGETEKALAVWEWSKSRLLDRVNRNLLNIRKASLVPLPRTAYPHIVYASFEDRLQIWLVQDGRTVGKSIPVKQAELLGSIRDFNIDCGNANSLKSEVERRGSRLYDLLLRPVIADLPPSGTVAIEFDDALPSFTIEALKNPDGSYFGENYVVLHSPGILAETFLRESVPFKLQEKFLVADAAESLRGHELPAAAISRTYANEVLTGADLTPQRLDQKMQTSVALLVVSHGMLGDEGIGLKLSEDWSLQAKDFTPQRLRQMRLVVLAACSSGYSENGLWGPDSLVRSVLASRVPNVIASRWDVDAQSTGELFESFYTYLGQGETPAQALHDARLKLRSKHTHPYYWASFYLTGKLPAAR